MAMIAKMNVLILEPWGQKDSSKILTSTLPMKSGYPKFILKVHILKWINCKINALGWSVNLYWLEQLFFAQAIKAICNKEKRISNASPLCGEDFLSTNTH